MLSISRQMQRKRRWLPSIMLSMVMLLLITPIAQAAGSEEPPKDWDVIPASPVGAEAIQGDDGGAWELGIHGSAGNLTQATAAERYGMSYWLSPLSNWVTKYSYNESTAWEEDFKRADLGGTNNNYVDAVDLQFYVGHGSPNGFTFDNASHDDSTLGYNDCERAWGDNDNEWVALTSCNVLDDAQLGQWAQCMNGNHLILGFKTTAYAHNNYADTQAYWFGYYVRNNYTMTQSWFKACDRVQRTKIVRVIGNELNCFDDKPNLGQVCGDSYDTDWWYWTHSCGTETAIDVPVERLAQEMPVFKTNPYSTAEANQDLERLGAVFSIPVTTTVEVATTGEDVRVSPFVTATASGTELEVDKSSGLYGYYNLDALWTSDSAEAAYAVTAASPTYINNDEARRIADSFLLSNGLMGPGSVFYEVISDTTSIPLDSAPGLPTETVASGITGDIQEVATAWQVIYSRHLVYTPTVTAAGVAAPIEFSVVGPGAKQKVYVPVNSAIMAASPLAEPVLGVQGGWRDVEQQFVVNAAGILEPLTISMLTTDTVRSLYNQLGEKVALADVPLDYKSREILSETAAYYEMAAGSSQAELIPVYEFKVRFTLQDDTIIDDFVDVPVNESYVRPLALIASGVPADSVPSGTALTLTAADASQTLQALGQGNFNFTLGSGDPDNYIYDWFIDSLDDGNKIGSGRTLSFEVPLGTIGHGTTRTVMLRVTDLGNPNKPATSVTSATINVDPTVFLPLISGD